MLNFSDFELEILKTTGGKLTFVPEPNGDQLLDPVTLYSRFACAAGFAKDSIEYHLGLYLLYVGVIDTGLVTNSTYV